MKEYEQYLKNITAFQPYLRACNYAKWNKYINESVSVED